MIATQLARRGIDSAPCAGMDEAGIARHLGFSDARAMRRSLDPQ
jgi:hypothetical protein